MSSNACDDRQPTLDEVRTFDPATAWDRLSPEQQRHVGAMAVELAIVQGARRILPGTPRKEAREIVGWGDDALVLLINKVEPLWPTLFGWKDGATSSTSAGPAPARLVVHIGPSGDLDYLSDRSPVELLIVDERAPRDRVYRHKSHAQPEGAIDGLIGSSRIGELGDMPGMEAAIRATLKGEQPKKPQLHIVNSDGDPA